MIWEGNVVKSRLVLVVLSLISLALLGANYTWD